MRLIILYFFYSKNKLKYFKICISNSQDKKLLGLLSLIHSSALFKNMGDNNPLKDFEIITLWFYQVSMTGVFICLIFGHYKA